MYRVALTSPEYGTDVFKYLTEDEAMAGIKRLRAQADSHTKEDGIERTVVYLGKETA